MEINAAGALWLPEAHCDVQRSPQIPPGCFRHGWECAFLSPAQRSATGSILTPRKTQNSAFGSLMHYPAHHEATIKILLLSWSDEHWYSEGQSWLQMLVRKVHPLLLRGHLCKH